MLWFLSVHAIYSTCMDQYTCLFDGRSWLNMLCCVNRVNLDIDLSVVIVGVNNRCCSLIFSVFFTLHAVSENSAR